MTQRRAAPTCGGPKDQRGGPGDTHRVGRPPGRDGAALRAGAPSPKPAVQGLVKFKQIPLERITHIDLFQDGLSTAHQGQTR